MGNVLDTFRLLWFAISILLLPLVARSAQWTQGIGAKGGIVNSIVIAPWNCDTLFAATFDGLLLSADGGERWKGFGEGLEGHHLRVLAADAADIGFNNR